MNKRHTCIVICALCSTLFLQAQSGKTLQIGLGLNAISYNGDFTLDQGPKRFHPGLDILLQPASKKTLRLQARVGYGKFSEQLDKGIFFVEEDDVEPNTFVETEILYTDVSLTVNFLKREILQPYLGLGLGLLFYTPKDKLGNPLGENFFTRGAEEVYGSNALSFPLTAGIRLPLNDKTQLELSYTYRLSMSDYLDNIGDIGTFDGNDAIQSFRFGINFNLRGDKGKKMEAPALQPIRMLSSRGALPGWVEDDWEAREEQAILMRSFVYYTPKPQETIAQIAHRFHLNPAKIKELNFLSDDPIAEGAILRLPNMGSIMAEFQLN